MPIEIKKLKELELAECYGTNRSKGVLTSVVLLLKDNQKNAFTPNEITESINKNYLDNILGNKPIKSSSINNALQNIKKSKHIHNIKNKGVYYWYEKQ